MDQCLNEVSTTLIGKDFAEFVSDAFKVVKIKFVDSINDFDSALEFEPEYVHQYFGVSENIVGYKDLKVSMCYASASLHLCPVIRFQSQIPENSHVKADDIVQKIRDQLSSTQSDSLVLDEVTFQKILDEQKKFQPVGQLVSKFNCVAFYDGNDKEILVYKVDCFDDQKNRFIRRAQSLSSWYIESAECTDQDDPRFFHYFAFEVTKSEDGSTIYKFVGYSTLYRFHYGLYKERVRISHILIAPPYQRSGCGIKFLSAIYSDLQTIERIYDITAETPVEKFVFIRDVVDCAKCFDLPEFSKNELTKGFSGKMLEAARSKFKINKNQARRVYEILRLHHSKSDKEACAAFKKDMKVRIEKPFLRNVGKLQRTFTKEELNVVLVNLEPETHNKIVEDIYKSTVDSYIEALNCLKKYEPKFLA